MIKLELPKKPVKLSVNEKQLTQAFLADKTKPVWKKAYIVAPLLHMTHGKCAYSEMQLGEEGKYVEVDHFKPKKLYPAEVAKWGNLLPSCNVCNRQKGDWDVVAQPIVNPLYDDPKDHLYIKTFRFYYKDKKGENTIQVLGLNDMQHFGLPRFKHADIVIKLLESNLSQIRKASQEECRMAARNVKNILESCGRASAYSASTATYLLYEFPTYDAIKHTLLERGRWDDELVALEKMLSELAMPWDTDSHKSLL